MTTAESGALRLPFSTGAGTLRKVTRNAKGGPVRDEEVSRRTGSGKLLIFVVAYNAETTIQSVLGRIPVAELPAGTEVLVIDDSSADKTFEVARRYSRHIGGLRITVLANPVNQGYGGNQKLGYRYAVENGFAAVALLHGDGQYAPENLPELVAPVLAGEADACFGSRMMTPGAARRGGMPLYKFVGNRILTGIQNRVLDLSLSEFHSGYRVYSVKALEHLPFALNANDFHFDTDIIIQFARSGLRIVEKPIPTYYGDEICYVNGMAYAWNVMRSTFASRLHGMGVLYQRKFDVAPGRRTYDAKLGYESSHSLALERVRDESDVLDLACGEGAVARELRRRGCRVDGVDRRDVAAGGFDRFFLHDLDQGRLPEGLGVYDFILALDCLEHLEDPETLLETLREQCYTGNTTLIMTVPNIAFIVTRLGLLAGQFNYGQQGILDLTHKRLFTFASFRRLLEQSGYVVLRERGIPAPFPKALGDHAFSRSLLRLNRFLARLWPALFAYQVYVEARFTPPLGRLLARTVDASETRSVP